MRVVTFYLFFSFRRATLIFWIPTMASIPARTIGTSNVRNRRVNKRNRAKSIWSVGRRMAKSRVVVSSAVAVVVRIVDDYAVCQRRMQSGVGDLIRTHHGDGKRLNKQNTISVTSQSHICWCNLKQTLVRACSAAHSNTIASRKSFVKTQINELDHDSGFIFTTKACVIRNICNTWLAPAIKISSWIGQLWKAETGSHYVKAFSKNSRAWSKLFYVCFKTNWAKQKNI